MKFLHMICGVGSLLAASAASMIAAPSLAVGNGAGEPSDLLRFALDVVGRVAIVALGVSVFVLMLLGVASAQDAVNAASTVVDFGPLVSLAIEIVAPIILTVLAGLASWALMKIQAKTGLQIDAQHRSAVEQALDRAIGFAATQLEDRAAGGIPIDLRSKAIATAINYARDAVPDALKHFGISGDRLAAMIEARLEGVLVDPAVERSDVRPLRGRSVTALA